MVMSEVGLEGGGGENRRAPVGVHCCHAHFNPDKKSGFIGVKRCLGRLKRKNKHPCAVKILIGPSLFDSPPRKKINELSSSVLESHSKAVSFSTQIEKWCYEHVFLV